jgi:hypothetical protein
MSKNRRKIVISRKAYIEDNSYIHWTIW